MAGMEDLSRRDFVRRAGTATAVAAATTLGRAPAIQKVRAANSQVLYGLIGPGSRGQELLRHLSKIDAGRCVAMCDVYEPNLEKGVATLGYSTDTYKDYRELLARKDIDGVIIAVPDRKSVV